MKELFNSDGHLTDYAFNAIVGDELNEINRLEVAEHTSFCDECLTKYINVLDSTELLCPSENVKINVINRISYINKKALLKQFIPMAIAACFAIVFWSTGVFTELSLGQYSFMNVASGFVQKNASITDSFSNNFNKIVDYLELKGAMPNEKE